MLVKMTFVLLISVKTLICMRLPNALLNVKKIVFIPCFSMKTKDHSCDKLASCFTKQINPASPV